VYENIIIKSNQVMLLQWKNCRGFTLTIIHHHFSSDKT